MGNASTRTSIGGAGDSTVTGTSSGAEHPDAGRRPCAAGSRWSPADTGQPRDPARLVPGRGPGTRHRGLVGPHWHRRCHGSIRRRLAHRRQLLALDLPDQRPHRPVGRGRRQPARPRVTRPRCFPPHRCHGGRAGRHGAGSTDLRADRLAHGGGTRRTKRLGVADGWRARSRWLPRMGGKHLRTDVASGHLCVSRVQRHQRRDVRGLCRAGRNLLLARPGASGRGRVDPPCRPESRCCP